jgi:hypothetical protein
MTDDTLTTYGDALALNNYGQAVILGRNDSLTDQFMAGFDKIYEMLAAPNNTPISQDYEFVLGDGTRLTFDEITAPGYTGSYRSLTGPALSGYAGVAPPDNGAYLNVMTTAEYSGSISIEVDYTGWDTDTQESSLVMLHYDGDSWVDITASLDTASNTISGTTTTLSPFVVAYPAGCCVARGDVNGSGAVNVSDLSFMVDYLFRGGPPPDCQEHADVNGSGAANVSDLSYFVDFLFRGGPAPVACP